MTEQELLLSDNFDKHLHQMSQETIRQIYKAYQLGEPVLNISEQYNITEKKVLNIVYRYKAGYINTFYRYNAPSQYYADMAEESLRRISEKYNTPNCRKKEP